MHGPSVTPAALAEVVRPSGAEWPMQRHVDHNDRNRAKPATTGTCDAVDQRQAHALYRTDWRVLRPAGMQVRPPSLSRTSLLSGLSSGDRIAEQIARIGRARVVRAPRGLLAPGHNLYVDRQTG